MANARVRDQQARDQQAHRKTVEWNISDIARYLQDALGSTLVAYVAGVADVKAVGAWASGDRVPRQPADERLRAAFQVFHLLQDEDSVHTVRAWFIGLNPQLDDDSPAAAIRDGRLKDVLVAARAYMAGG